MRAWVRVSVSILINVECAFHLLIPIQTQVGREEVPLRAQLKEVVERRIITMLMNSKKSSKTCFRGFSLRSHDEVQIFCHFVMYNPPLVIYIATHLRRITCTIHSFNINIHLSSKCIHHQLKHRGDTSTPSKTRLLGVSTQAATVLPDY